MKQSSSLRSRPNVALLGPSRLSAVCIGLILGACSATMRSRDGWFAACCRSCEVDSCSGCNDAPSNVCTDEAATHRARCRVVSGVLTCKPARPVNAVDPAEADVDNPSEHE